MDIRTKFNIDDTAYIVHNDSIQSYSIQSIKIEVIGSTTIIVYRISPVASFREEYLYASRNECALAWLEEQDIWADDFKEKEQ